MARFGKAFSVCREALMGEVCVKWASHTRVCVCVCVIYSDTFTQCKTASDWVTTHCTAGRQALFMANWRIYIHI